MSVYNLIKNIRIYPVLRVLTLSLGLGCLLSQQAFSAPNQEFKFSKKDRWDFNFETIYGVTEANFDKSGNSYSRLTSGNSFKTLDMDLGLQAGLTPRWSVYSSGRFSLNDASFNSLGVSTSKSASGLSRFILGSDFLLLTGSTMVFSDINLVVPTTKLDRTGSGNPPLGEGVMEINTKLNVRWERKSYRLGGFSGISYRDSGRSLVVPYGMLFEMSFGKSALGTSLTGYGSMTHDSDSDKETQQEIYFCNNSGCAKKYGAFNPSLMKLDFWFRGFMTNDIGYHIGGSYDVTGSNVAKGYQVYGGLNFRFGGKATPSAPADKFEEHTEDGVDQSAFGGSPTNPPPAPKPQKKKVNLQKELNATEKLLETSPEGSNP